MLVVSEDEVGVTFDVLAAPRASRERIGPIVGDRLKVMVTSAPVDGEANAAVIACLARALGVPKSAVTITRGEASRRKTIRIAGVRRSAVEQLVAAE